MLWLQFSIVLLGSLSLSDLFAHLGATEEAFLTHIFFCRDSEIASFLQNQTKTANRTTMLLSCFKNEGIHLRVSCTLSDSFAWFGLSLDFIMRLKVNFCVLFWWRDEIHKVSGEGKWNIRKVFIPKFDKAGHFVLWQNPRDVFFCLDFAVEFKASIEKWLYEGRKTFKITEMLPFSATEYFGNNFNKL